MHNTLGPKAGSSGPVHFIFTFMMLTYILLHRPFHCSADRALSLLKEIEQETKTLGPFNETWEDGQECDGQRFGPNGALYLKLNLLYLCDSRHFYETLRGMDLGPHQELSPV